MLVTVDLVGTDEDRQRLETDAEPGEREGDEQVEKALEPMLKDGDHEEQRDDDQLNDEEERQDDLQHGKEEAGLIARRPHDHRIRSARFRTWSIAERVKAREVFQKRSSKRIC